MSIPSRIAKILVSSVDNASGKLGEVNYEYIRGLKLKVKLSFINQES